MRRTFFSQPWVLLFLGIVVASSVNTASATTSSEAEGIVISYIESLSAGEVDQIRSLIGGAVLERSERSLDSGEKYGAFLRKYYNGVHMSVSSVEPAGDNYLVSVLFVYPTGDTETIIFTVADENGQVRIIDEKM